VQVAGAAWRVMMRIVAGVGDMVQRTGDGRTGRVHGGRAIERSGGAACDLHHHVETRSMGFLVEPQNQGQWFVSDLASKPLGRVSRFGPQNRQLRFGDLGLKITAAVSWVVPQNQADFGLLVAPQNQWSEDGTGHTSRSGGLLCL
jgi:hypothetical protein